MSRTIDADVVGNQLSVVLVGGEHKGRYADGICLFGQSTDDIVGFETVNLYDGNVVCLQNLLDDGNRRADVFRSLFTLRLVGRKSLVAEGGAMRIEGHADVCGLLFGEHLIECVDKAHNG